jgi:hypothetical protein
MSATFTSTYSRTHTAKYVSDKMRNVLKYLISYYNLNPTSLLDAWTSWVDAGARELLERDDLEKIIVEFYKPGGDVALGRWDFPIRYDGNGADEMWVDRMFLQDSFAKTTTPPAGCIYRVLLVPRPGAVLPSNLSYTTFKSLDGMVGREAGTIVSTPDIMASMMYYRK